MKLKNCLALHKFYLRFFKLQKRNIIQKWGGVFFYRKWIILTIFNIFAATWIGSTLSGIVLSYQWGSMGDAVMKVLTMLIPSVWVYPANRFVIHRKKKVVPSET